jgi:hypothetical protein
MTGVGHVEDLSPDGKLEYSQDYRAGSLKPSGIHVLWAA